MRLFYLTSRKQYFSKYCLFVSLIRTPTSCIFLLPQRRSHLYSLFVIRSTIFLFPLLEHRHPASTGKRHKRKLFQPWEMSVLLSFVSTAEKSLYPIYFRQPNKERHSISKDCFLFFPTFFGFFSPNAKCSLFFLFFFLYSLF